MTAWRLARSLDVLRDEMNERFPDRSKASDGTIGNSEHSSRVSDHNPNSAGVVCAIDITEDNKGGFSEIVDFMVSTIIENRDTRVKYLIHEGTIWRSYAKPGIPAWTPARYTGPNGHFQHGHVSVLPEKNHYDSTKAWGILIAKKPERPTAVTEARALLGEANITLSRALKKIKAVPADRKVVRAQVDELWAMILDVRAMRVRLPKK